MWNYFLKEFFMKKNEMIKKHQEFTDIIINSRYVKNRNFTLYIRNSEYEYPHFGIAVSKKLGNAVERNKIKRRMRVILDENKNSLLNNKDYIIIMKENSKNLSFKELNESFKDLIKIKGERYENKK